MTVVRRCVKDPFAGLSHWAGFGASVAGLAVLLLLAAGRPRYVVSLTVYGSSLVLLYAASALAHTVHCSPRASERLTRFDYMAIFLLIAGTYTPLCLVRVGGPWGWGMLLAEWTMAAAGIVLVACGRGQSDWKRTILYLCMAWGVGLVGMQAIVAALPQAGVVWLLLGGAAYSVGAVIFATDRPDLWPGRFVAHDLWHVLVLLGSACHFVVIFRFVARA